MKKSTVSKPTRTKAVLEIKNVSKVYKLGDDNLTILKNISVSIHAGELVAIVGPSGSGKSTLMHIMGLLDKQTTGKVILDGQDVSELNEEVLAKMRNISASSFNSLISSLVRPPWRMSYSPLCIALIPVIKRTRPKNS